uniref:NADH-ubiquinone oxidoreductase chain 4 n=1 Tax=Rhinebothrium reydai TaxID=2572012 RepID=A0A5B9RJM2_9CEST|nr:NADH dehydrogenase subunit 4 [Rhinebothrium reydai]QEG77660.1 NADH dehydrogenase subunit 4 [Rhinebothrium reydai]
MGVYNFIGCSILLGFILFSCSCLVYSAGVGLAAVELLSSRFFIFDSLSFYMVLLVTLLGAFSVISVGYSLSVNTKVYLALSLVFSGVCFCTNHAILFWCFYELSMLPLLFLIFKDSPYSERFLAGWYFAVYLLVTSLPLILILLYLSSVGNSFTLSEWGNNGSLGVYTILSLVFFTKVPLSPFHTWLPIVHAEATSIVSIYLSGYIMKLGLLGVYRCTPFLFSGDFYFYLFFCCVLSVFFIITASTELDGKRWLAFLSLSHIVVSFLAFYVCSWETISLSFVFCLGHGLSAGLVFGMLWMLYDTAGSRNWLLLKGALGGSSSTVLMVLSLLSLCSFPPTLQFFCEVKLLSESTFSYLFILFWGVYLFFGGLVPLVLCGHTLIRIETVESGCYNSFNFYFFFMCLVMWCYFGVALI